MNQLRQVKKSIAMKIGVVARRWNSECWVRFMDHSPQRKKIFQQFCHLATVSPDSLRTKTGMQELDPGHWAWEKRSRAWEKSGF